MQRTRFKALYAPPRKNPATLQLIFSISSQLFTSCSCVKQSFKFNVERPERAVDTNISVQGHRPQALDLVTPRRRLALNLKYPYKGAIVQDCTADHEIEKLRCTELCRLSCKTAHIQEALVVHARVSILTSQTPSRVRQPDCIEDSPRSTVSTRAGKAWYTLASIRTAPVLRRSEDSTFTVQRCYVCNAASKFTLINRVTDRRWDKHITGMGTRPSLQRADACMAARGCADTSRASHELCDLLRPLAEPAS